MDPALDHVVGGRLKLKGSKLATLPPASGKKKRKKRLKTKTKANMSVPRERAEEGYMLPVDPRTPAEIAHEEKQKRREEAVIRDLASKTHRERVDKFNENLATASEHFDIPKVASAGLG